MRKYSCEKIYVRASEFQELADELVRLVLRFLQVIVDDDMVEAGREGQLIRSFLQTPPMTSGRIRGTFDEAAAEPPPPMAAG